MKDDISLDPEEMQAYRGWVTCHEQLPAKVAEEFKDACRHDLVNRVSVLSEIVQEESDVHILKRPLVEDDGQNLLHLSSFSDSTVVGCHLVTVFGRDLVARVCDRGPYRGATPVHIACLHGNVKLVRAMVEILTKDECNVLLNSEATGSFFQENLQVGGLPLTIAMWAGHKQLCRHLISWGAQLDMKDARRGQTAIHALVHMGQHWPELAVDMMQWVLSLHGGYLWWSMRCGFSENIQSKFQLVLFQHYLLKLEDKDKLTPLLLAGKLGVPEIITFLVNVEGVYRHTVWNSRRVSRIQYDMREIDPAVNSGPNKSLLEYITYMDNHRTVRILAEEPFRSILKTKWQSYKWFFLAFALLHLSIMVIFTASIIVKDTPESNYERKGRIFGHATVAGCALVYLVLELVDMGVSVREWYSIPGLPLRLVCKPDVFRPVGCIFSVLTLVGLALRFAERPEEDIVTVVAGTAGWYMLFGFTRMFRVTGFFTVTVHQVLIRDILRFSIVIAVLLVSFSLGMYILTNCIGVTNTRHSTQSYGDIIINMFVLMVGLKDLELPIESRWSKFATFYVVCFIVMSTLTLLSMLVAAMTNTYAKIIKRRDDVWRRNRLLSILIAERRLCAPCMAHIRTRYLEYNGKFNTWLFSVEKINSAHDDS